MFVDIKVVSKVKRVMQSLPTSHEPCFNGSSITIQRRNPRKRKGGKSEKSYEKPKTPTFKKKLVVFKLMGERPPHAFRRKEDDILRGLLPEISVEACEREIRGEIIELLHNSKEFPLGDFDESDFEFIDVSGKKVAVPTCGDRYEFNGKAVKQIAGVGAVHIRLTSKIPRRVCYISDDSDFEPSFKINGDHIDSDSSFKLPPLPPSLPFEKCTNYLTTSISSEACSSTSSTLAATASSFTTSL